LGGQDQCLFTFPNVNKALNDNDAIQAAMDNASIAEAAIMLMC